MVWERVLWLIFSRVFHEESRQGGAGSLSDFYTPMHEVTPKVVAMAVSTVIKMFRIFPQMFLFSMIE